MTNERRQKLLALAQGDIVMAAGIPATRAVTSRPRQAPGSRVTQHHPGAPEAEAGPEVGPWGRFAALPPHQRRALVACAAWLISGYFGVVLFAAGIDHVLATSNRSLGVLFVALGAALAVFGFARARNRVARGSDWSA